MKYWLVKSEPNAWSWDEHVKAGTAEWDGVRSHQACGNMKAMKIGDMAFFAEIQATLELENMTLVRQSRLSVMPVAAKEWKLILKMSGTKL